MASRLESRSPYYTRIRREAYGLWEQGWIPKATEALGDQTRTDEVRAVGFAILEWMGVTNRSALGTFLQRMKEGGEKLDTVASNVLGGSREDLLKASGAYIASQYGRLR